MKKLVLLGLCMVIVVSGAFALDKNIGGGGLFGYTFSGGDLDYSALGYEYRDVTGTWKMPRSSFGFFGFFGISQYFEFNIGYLRKSISEVTMTAKYMGETATETQSGDEFGVEDTGALQLGVYFKYPFVLSDRLVLFPTGGVDIEITLSDDEGWWNDVWLRGGVGLDFFFTERIFLRGHAIYGAAIPFGGDIPMFETNFGHGLLIKLGVGFML